MRVTHVILNPRYQGLANLCEHPYAITAATRVETTGYLWWRKETRTTVYLIRYKKEYISNGGCGVDIDYIWRTAEEHTDLATAKARLEELLA